jgi:DNA mismatch endonuclease (patch repair protein)
VIFVHGCFWHGHKCRRGDRLPKNNQDYWRNKIGRNRERDRAVKKALSKAGWKVAVVWECEIGKPERLTKKLTAFL